MKTAPTLKYTQYADPFWGNGECRLPAPEGIAAAWPFLKGQTGNTHPGAVPKRPGPSGSVWPFPFATMWDMYKTQLPLVCSLMPERARDIVNAMMLFAAKVGSFPNLALLIGDPDPPCGQARALAFYTILDAFHRGGATCPTLDPAVHNSSLQDNRVGGERRVK